MPASAHPLRSLYPSRVTFADATLPHAGTEIGTWVGASDVAGMLFRWALFGRLAWLVGVSADVALMWWTVPKARVYALLTVACPCRLTVCLVSAVLLRCARAFGLFGTGLLSPPGRHQRTVHEKARRHPCTVPGCTAAFSESSHVRTHMRTVHERRRDFVCNICNTALSTRSVLAKHKRNVHDDYVRLLCHPLPDLLRFPMSSVVVFFQGLPSSCQRTCLFDSAIVYSRVAWLLLLTRSPSSGFYWTRHASVRTVAAVFRFPLPVLAIPHRGHTSAPCANCASPSGATWSATPAALIRRVPLRTGGSLPMRLMGPAAAPSPTVLRCCPVRPVPVASHRLLRLLGCTERRSACASVFFFFC